MDNDDEQQTALTRWHDDATTRKKARAYALHAEKDLKHLLNKCKDSTDPEVLKASSVYQLSAGFSLLLRGPPSE